MFNQIRSKNSDGDGKMIVFSDIMHQIRNIKEMIIRDIEMDAGGDGQNESAFFLESHVFDIQSWFFRSSYKTKRRFIKCLIAKVSRADTLGAVLRAICLANSKSAIVVQQWNKTNNSADQIPNDHNRSISSKSLLQLAFDDDVALFATMTHNDQLNLLLGLLRLSGPAILQEALRFGRHILETHQRIKKGVVTEEPSDPNLKRSADKVTIAEENPKIRHDANTIIHPQPKELKNKLAAFEDAVKKLRLELKVEYEETVREDGSCVKKMKMNRDRKIFPDTVDKVQCLPFAVIMKILSYLDERSLMNLRDVNEYWVFAVSFHSSNNSTRAVFVEQEKVAAIALKAAKGKKRKNRKKETKDKKVKKEKKLKKEKAAQSPKRGKKGKKEKEAKGNAKADDVIPESPGAVAIEEPPVAELETAKSKKVKQEIARRPPLDLIQRRKDARMLYTFRPPKKNSFKPSELTRTIDVEVEKLYIRGSTDPSVYDWCAKMLAVGEEYDLARPGHSEPNNDDHNFINDNTGFFQKFSFTSRKSISTPYRTTVQDLRLKPSSVNFNHIYQNGFH